MSGVQPPAIPVFYAGQNPVPQLNAMSQAFAFLESKVAFRARRAATGTVTKGAYTTVPWDTIDEDPYGGWSALNSTVYTVQAPGWYGVTGTVSITGTGAANMPLIPTFAVNGGSQTGQGGSGWEGVELFPPAGGPMWGSSYWEGYCNLGDTIALRVFIGSEPAANLAWQTASGQQTRIELVWMGV